MKDGSALLERFSHPRLPTRTACLPARDHRGWQPKREELARRGKPRPTAPDYLFAIKQVRFGDPLIRDLRRITLVQGAGGVLLLRGHDNASR
jgi:hypothetical protein